MKLPIYAVLLASSVIHETAGLPNHAWSEPHTLWTHRSSDSTTKSYAASNLTSTNLALASASHALTASSTLHTHFTRPPPLHSHTPPGPPSVSVTSQSSIVTETHIHPSLAPPVERHALLKRHDWAMVCRPYDDALGSINMQKECQEIRHYCDANGRFIGEDSICAEFCDCFNLKTGMTEAGCNRENIKAIQPIVNPSHAICGATQQHFSVIEQLSPQSSTLRRPAFLPIHSSRPLDDWALFCSPLFQSTCKDNVYCDDIGIMHPYENAGNEGCRLTCQCFNLVTGQANPGETNDSGSGPSLSCPPDQIVGGLEERQRRSLQRRHDWAMICRGMSFQKRCRDTVYCDKNGIMRTRKGANSDAWCPSVCDCFNMATGQINPGKNMGPPPPRPFPFCLPGDKTCGLKKRQPSSLQRRHDWAMVCYMQDHQQKCTSQVYCSEAGVMRLQKGQSDPGGWCRLVCYCFNVVTGVIKTGAGYQPPPKPFPGVCLPGIKNCGFKKRALQLQAREKEWGLFCELYDIQIRCNQEAYCDSAGVVQNTRGASHGAACATMCDCVNLKTGAGTSGVDNELSPPPKAWCPRGSKACHSQKSLSLSQGRGQHWAFFCHGKVYELECNPNVYCDVNGVLQDRRGVTPDGMCQAMCDCKDPIAGVFYPGSNSRPRPMLKAGRLPGQKTCGLENCHWAQSLRHDRALMCLSFEVQKMCNDQVLCDAKGKTRSMSQGMNEYCRSACSCNNFVSGLIHPGPSSNLPPIPPTFCLPGNKACGLKKSGRSVPDEAVN